MKNTIVFVDIVSSSKAWKNHPNGMQRAIKKHFDIVKQFVKKYRGNIVKTIGDAHMIVFSGNKSLRKAIAFSIELQYIHKDKPIYINKQSNMTIKFRVGIAYGKMHPMRSKIQGCMLQDYIGATVNIASRMESKISGKTGFAFFSEGAVDRELLQALNTIGKVNTIIVDNNCLRQQKQIRSTRILNPECMNPKELKGVGELMAYKVTLF